MWVFEAFYSKKIGGYSCFGEGIRVFFFLEMFEYFFEYYIVTIEYFRIRWDTLGYFGIYFGILWNTLRNTYI